MKFGFEESQREFVSGSQAARVWTERWVSDWAYCPNCGNSRIEQFRANMPVADFFCPACGEQYELKSHKKPLGKKVPDGAYEAKKERLAGDSNPSLLLLRYSLESRSVVDLCTVPKHFFALDIIEKRKPLRPTARRPGWVGSNILINRLPPSAKIFLVRDGRLSPRKDVLAAWKRTLFLREVGTEARGWLIEVMQCVEAIGKQTFALEEVYAFEERLGSIYPRNRHVRPKIRQQLQVLRDHGYLEFTTRGTYRLAQT